MGIMSNNEELNKLNSLLSSHFNEEYKLYNDIANGVELTAKEQEKRDRALAMVKELESDEELSARIQSIIEKQ